MVRAPRRAVPRKTPLMCSTAESLGRGSGRALFVIAQVTKSSGAVDAAYSRRITLSSELWICRWPLYSMKPNFLNLFMN